MATQQKKKQTEPQQLTNTEKLGLRISTMLTAPQAQLDRVLKVYRLDSDEDEAWDSIMGLIAESGGVDMVFNDDESVTISWEMLSDEDPAVEEEDEFRVVPAEAPF